MKSLTLTLLLSALLPMGVFSQKPTDTPVSQMEKLDRGLVVIPYNLFGGHFVSWRLFGTDDANTTFELLKNGESVKSNIMQTTSVRLTGGKATDKYQVVTYQNGKMVDTTPEVSPWAKYYLEVKLDKPADGKTKPYTTTIDKETVSFPDGQDYSYSPNDCSVGDVDGDGRFFLPLAVLRKGGLQRHVFRPAFRRRIAGDQQIFIESTGRFVEICGHGLLLFLWFG